MRNAQCVRRCFSFLVQPPERDPVADEGNVSGHFQCCGLEFTGLKDQAFPCLGSNPVSNATFMNQAALSADEASDEQRLWDLANTKKARIDLTRRRANRCLQRLVRCPQSKHRY